jgi:hypothetical protein
MDGFDSIEIDAGDDVQGHAIDAGNFFPEEAPGPTADALQRFFLAP